MNKALLLRFIEVQALLLAPFTPHFSEHIWRNMLGKVRRFAFIYFIFFLFI
jgi:leucyl-tRNA synthetase